MEGKDRWPSEASVAQTVMPTRCATQGELLTLPHSFQKSIRTRVLKEGRHRQSQGSPGLIQMLAGTQRSCSPHSSPFCLPSSGFASSFSNHPFDFLNQTASITFIPDRGQDSPVENVTDSQGLAAAVGALGVPVKKLPPCLPVGTE